MSKDQGLFVVCAVCGKKKHIHPYEVKRRKFCSTPCLRIGMWNGKHYKVLNGRNEHRVLAELAVGHALSTKTPIHHFVSFDNSTLVICQDNAYHFLLHRRQRAYEATGDPHKVKCVICHKWDDPRNMTIAKKRNYHKDCNTGYEKHRNWLKRDEEARI